ncbi:hypothetical protein COL154_013989, partial [Colletotrichum chrysophilum]
PVTGEAAQPPRNRLRVLLALLPLVIFAALAVTFYMQLESGEDASLVPSALIGKPVPNFTLPPIAGVTRDGAPMPGLATADLKEHVSLVNVWASWCVPCREEAPLLMQLASDKRYRLVGINYKDKPDNARAFLRELGDPFQALGADTTGNVGIEWGVYGVPETYLVSADGRILYKRVGPFTQDAIRTILMPKVEKALKEAGEGATTSAGNPS